MPKFVRQNGARAHGRPRMNGIGNRQHVATYVEEVQPINIPCLAAYVETKLRPVSTQGSEFTSELTHLIITEK